MENYNFKGEATFSTHFDRQVVLQRKLPYGWQIVLTSFTGTDKVVT